MLSTITILFLLTVVAFLYFRLRRYDRITEEISAFAGSFLRGSLNKLYFPEDKFSRVSSSLNAMASDMRSRINDMAEERNKINAILKCMNSGVLITDTKARVILANPAIMTLLGIKTDIIGESVIVATRVAELQDLASKVIESEEEISEEIDIIHPNRLSLMATAVPLYSYEVRERISGVVLSIHDITRIKKLEDMRKSFVASVSHEIKTPITAIKGFAETLLDGAIEDRDNAVRFLETIKAHSERLNTLVEDLLTLSRIELGDINIDKRDVNIEHVIDTVFTTLKDKAHAKGLYLKRSLSSPLPDILSDKDRLVQILLNLVENGIKFTESGGITVGVEKTDGQTLLYVEDTGIGIAKEHIPRLGERFYRVDNARSRELGGTGLGLAIVKHLVKAHGWNMKVESTHGKGTRVNIIIPDASA